MDEHNNRCMVCFLVITFQTAVVPVSASSGTGAAVKPIQVLLNEKPVAMPVAPIKIEGVTLVPFRALFDALGFEVSFNQENQAKAIVGTRKDVTIMLQIGNLTAQVNGKQLKLRTAPFIQAGTTFVPLRFVAEATNKDVTPVGNSIIIRNKSGMWFLTDEYPEPDRGFSNKPHFTDYAGEDQEGNVFVYWTETVGKVDHIYASIMKDLKWQVRDKEIATTDSLLGEVKPIKLIQGNTLVVRDKQGLRFIDFAADGSVRRNEYLFKSTVLTKESVTSLRTSEGGRGVVYNRGDGKSVLYLFDDLEHHITLNKELSTEADFWIYDGAGGSLAEVNGEQLSLYDLNGNLTSSSSGKPNIFNATIPKGAKISNIVYDKGLIYYLFNHRTGGYTDIETVQYVITPNNGTGTSVNVSFKQDYLYHMGFQVANNWHSDAGIYDGELRVFCTQVFQPANWFYIGVMEMD
ncbi:copper amine oxidase N-terminal domain-containing protein [Paenibacillus sp. OV219]|uniref:copper amine oxidase N-terminal domain-containing protein n=1 Tax=Paenibacillus sp. OV219 TaxID=1884377 RepID=UPI0008B93A8C|nr:copper amine oxidase N-terminal domain-containing protein [Paenibacillus sp. OV219]SEO98014.1 Copper amine oxidase N-terminal domain-containing protein [Paenibacillus sp. OV219]